MAVAAAVAGAVNVSFVDEHTRQGGLEGDYDAGGYPWRREASRFYDVDTATPRQTLIYRRRMLRNLPMFYAGVTTYLRATAGPEVPPSLATCEQLPIADAVPDFSAGSLSQSENGVSAELGEDRDAERSEASSTREPAERVDIDDRLARRVQSDDFGMNPAQAFGLEMAFSCGIDDPETALDFATKSLDSGGILSMAAAADDDRRELILGLLAADEVAHAKALATCGEMSIQLGCPQMAGGCGHDHNYVPTSCDSRLCPDCQASRTGTLTERYAQVVETWRNPIFGTFTIPNVHAETAEDLRTAVDAITGAFGRLRRRTIPPEGETGEKRWVWRSDGGEPASDYWRQDLIRRGHRDRADRLEREYVGQGRNIPFEDLIDEGFYTVDVKQVEGDEFNVHLHTLWNGAYVPNAALSKVWEDLTGAPVVDVRRVYDRHGGASAVGAVLETVAYACKPPEFEDSEQEVRYFQALKGKRMAQPFGELFGNVPDAAPSLLCSECDGMPAWWDYLGVVDDRIDNMGSIHDGESTGHDPPSASSGGPIA